MDIGDRVGKLVLTNIIPGDAESGWHRKGEFKCDCGKEITRYLDNMFKPSMYPRNCGCVKRKKTGGNKACSLDFDGDMAQSFYLGRM